MEMKFLQKVGFVNSVIIGIVFLLWAGVFLLMVCLVPTHGPC